MASAAAMSNEAVLSWRAENLARPKREGIQMSCELATNDQLPLAADGRHARVALCLMGKWRRSAESVSHYGVISGSRLGETRAPNSLIIQKHNIFCSLLWLLSRASRIINNHNFPLDSSRTSRRRAEEADIKFRPIFVHSHSLSLSLLASITTRPSEGN